MIRAVWNGAVLAEAWRTVRLEGNDYISQVVPAVPYSGRTLVVQACPANYSTIVPSAVRNLCDTSLGGNVRFIGTVLLTLA
ncbi:MAG: hypothetical protein ACRDPY_32760 [Streptosporangiaceae bacterium]